MQPTDSHQVSHQDTTEKGPERGFTHFYKLHVHKQSV